MLKHLNDKSAMTKNPMSYSTVVKIYVKIWLSIRSMYPINTKKKKGKC